MAKKPKVIKYDGSNTNEMDEKLNKGFDGIVLFHHPQCIHCVMLRPKWEMVKKKLHNGGEIMEVNVEALEKSNSPLRHKVKGYPTLAHVKNNDMADQFKEERNIENMLRFINKHINNKTNNLNYSYKINKTGNVKKIKKRKTRKGRKGRKN